MVCHYLINRDIAADRDRPNRSEPERHDQIAMSRSSRPLQRRLDMGVN